MVNLANFVIIGTQITNIKHIIMKHIPRKEFQAYESPQAECLLVRTGSAFLYVSGGEPESITEDDVELDFNY